MIKHLLNLLYPPKCIFCKSILTSNNIRNNFVCNRCYSSLPFIASDLTSLKNRNITNSLIKNYYFIDCISTFYYAPPISNAICNFKFHNKQSYYLIFANYLSETIKHSYSNIIFDYITYIPMHKSKEHKRRYNQAQLLASQISKTLKIPLRNLLIKHINNKNQHSLSLNLRSTNIKDVYKISNKYNTKQKTILLIDDIITSGHTLNEASKVLKMNGAKDIYCATIASSKIKNKCNLLKYLQNINK